MFHPRGRRVSGTVLRASAVIFLAVLGCDRAHAARQSHPASEITGVVHGPDGRPVQGARVSVIDSSLADFGLDLAPPANSDARGRFRASGLGEGPFLVTATWLEPGESSPAVVRLPWAARQDGVAPGTRDLVLALDPGSTIRGRAENDRGEPLRAFQIVLTERRKEELGHLVSATIRPSDVRSDDGSFEIRGVQKGSWDVQAVAAGHVQSDPVRLALPAPTEPLRLVAPREARLSGIVVDPSGVPVPHARVSALAPGERGMAFFDAAEEELALSLGPMKADRRARGPMGSRERIYTDTLGRFEIVEVRAGPTVLRAVARGHTSALPRTIAVEAGQTIDGLRIELRRGATIRGVVRDPAGNPLAGVDVGVIAEDDSTWHVTGDDGAFRFDHVPPTRILMAAREDLPPGAKPRLEPEVIERSFAVGAGEVAEIVLGGPRARSVRVRGVLTRGAPVAGARVRFTPGRTGAAYVQARTNEAGEYALDLAEQGEYWVLLLLPSDSMAERRVWIGDAPEQTIDLDLPGTLLRGRVLDAHDRPVEAELRLRRMDLESSDGGWSTVASDRTAEDGTFVFEGLDRGPWRMRVQPAGDGRATQFVAVDLAAREIVDDLVVRIEGPGAIEGVVRDSDGRPVAGARVTARGADGLDYDDETPAAERVTTDVAGRYRIDRLSPGVWHARAVAGDLASTESGALRVAAGALARADLVLAPGGYVEVALESATGEALRHGPGAWTRVLDARGRPWVDLEAERFGLAVREFGPLPPGRWSVRRAGARPFTTADVDLAPGGRVSITLRERE